MYHTEYALGIEVDGSFDSVVSRTADALKVQGFGVLSNIDVKATLKKKLDVDFRRNRILGACNPALAHEALLEETPLGLLLPCNVVVYEVDEHRCAVAAVDPVRNLGIVGNAALRPIAEKVRTKLETVLGSLESIPVGS